MDFKNIVLNKLDKIHDDVSDLKVENAKQTANIAKNTEDLAEHIEGVKQTRTLIKQNAVRIDKVEEKVAPITVKQLFKRIVYIAGGIGTIVGMTIAIMKLFNL